MPSLIEPEPDQGGSVIRIGQVPSVSFDLLRSWETALPHAASARIAETQR
jgi:hypothetical protein